MSVILLVTVVLLEEAILTWYGGEFIGRHHAAYWHGETPPGFSQVVDPEEFGVAAPITIPFGTQLVLTRLDTGQTVEAVVVDRMKNYTNPVTYDAYPAVAEALGFGPAYEDEDVGVVKVKVERIGEDDIQSMHKRVVGESVLGRCLVGTGSYRTRCAW